MGHEYRDYWRKDSTFRDHLYWQPWDKMLSLASRNTASRVKPIFPQERESYSSTMCMMGEGGGVGLKTEVGCRMGTISSPWLDKLMKRVQSYSPGGPRQIYYPSWDICTYKRYMMKDCWKKKHRPAELIWRDYNSEICLLIVGIKNPPIDPWFYSPKAIVNTASN